ncbi:MAG: Restriction modification system DNA specificity domain protein [Syntrophaceae bacterium]|nr:MAG: Restriction modification system DNA specificity domain protein [Syntrophaceae bacterium]
MNSPAMIRQILDEVKIYMAGKAFDTNCLPLDWKFDRLKDVALVNRTSLTANTDPDYEFDYLEISNVNYHGIIDHQAIEHLRYEDAPSRARRRVGKNNTVISSVRPNLQAVAFLPDVGQDFVCSTGFNVVQAREIKHHPKFVYYTLISESARQYFESIAKGVGYPAIDEKDFNSLPLPLPPRPEQERIAAFLDASCAAIDAAVSAKQRQIETLDSIVDATLHKAFANAEWPQERIKDVTIKIGSGVTPEGGAANYLNEGIPLLRSQNIHFDGLHLDDVAFISEETHAEMSNSQIKPRDVLLNITGASIGRCTYVPENFGEGNVNQHVCIIRGNHQIDYRFLSSFLSSPIGQGQVLSSFTGASRQGLSHIELGLISVPLPSIDVQRTIIADLERRMLQQKQIHGNIESQITTLTTFRKSLIYECVTGQRRIMESDLKKVKAYG